MLSQVKQIMDPTGRKQVAGRLGAWWDGREYVPEPESGDDGETAPDPEAAASDTPAATTKARPPITPADAQTDGARITALERMWGMGRLGPAAIDNEILDQLETDLLADGDIGMMGADPALLRAWTQRSERSLFASEWRAGALERVRRAVPDVPVIDDDIDRAKGFPDDALAALASVNTMAYADHKAGLVSRAFHVLKDGGRWVIVDTVRTTAKTPPQAFASAWAEPLLAEDEEVDGLLEKAGFDQVSKQNLTAQMIETARTQMNELGAALETTVAEGMSGSDGVLFLRELVWELKSWRARLKALEGGALQVFLWVATKGGAEQADQPVEDQTPETSVAPVEEPEASIEDAAPAAVEEEPPEEPQEDFAGPSDDEMAARIAAMVADSSGSDAASDNAELDESLFDTPT